MTRHFTSATMTQRRQMIEDALARVLHRDSTMTVSTDQGEPFLYVYEAYGDARRKHSLWAIASELEVLLS